MFQTQVAGIPTEHPWGHHLNYCHCFQFIFRHRKRFVSNLHFSSQAMEASTQHDDSHLVVVFGDEKVISKQGDYRLNRLFWECYGSKWGVVTRFLNPYDFNECRHHSNWFMSRVCAMAVLVEGLNQSHVPATLKRLDLDLKGIRWVIHLDADTIPTALSLPLSAFTNAWAKHDLVFYERFHNGEITAGNYGVRVTQTAAHFLRGWESQAQQSSFSNG